MISGFKIMIDYSGVYNQSAIDSRRVSNSTIENITSNLELIAREYPREERQYGLKAMQAMHVKGMLLPNALLTSSEKICIMGMEFT